MRFLNRNIIEYTNHRRINQPTLPQEEELVGPDEYEEKVFLLKPYLPNEFFMCNIPANALLDDPLNKNKYKDNYDILDGTHILEDEYYNNRYIKCNVSIYKL